jgi:regulator of protease activity HflC (stomatin/prohibitin superfamily)
MLALALAIIAGIIIIICVIRLSIDKNDHHRFTTVLIGAIAFIIALGVWLFSSFFTVGPREVGVKFDPLEGGIQPKIYQQGIHAKAPWQTVTTFNTATQSYNMTKGRDDSVSNVTREGLNVDLDITVFYNIIPDKAPFIKNNLGEDGVYQESVVRPAIRSVIRNVIAQHTAEEAYSSEKPVIENEILDNLNVILNPRFIQVQDVLLRDIILPSQLTSSITAKRQAQQEALAMEFVLQKAELEKQRKVIEAEGIAEANNVIAGSLTESYLHWHWLDKLEKSNSVIYVPTEGGLPLFNDIDQVAK